MKKYHTTIGNYKMKTINTIMTIAVLPSVQALQGLDGIFEALIGSEFVPLDGFLFILRHTLAVLIAFTKIKLCKFVFMFCGFAIPFNGLFKILNNATSQFVADT